ncbi:MAG: DUF3054 domain-containing protein, partial [Promethearchaeia archaeon]
GRTAGRMAAARHALALLLVMEGAAAFLVPSSGVVLSPAAARMHRAVARSCSNCRWAMQQESGRASLIEARLRLTQRLGDVRARPVVAGGDMAALLVFAAVGRANHSSDNGSVLLTSLPFLFSWFLVAPALGAFKPPRSLGHAVAAILPAWAVSVPLACVIRGVVNDRMPAAPFWLVALAATGVLLGSWRAAHFQTLVVSKTIDDFTEAIVEDEDD